MDIKSILESAGLVGRQIAITDDGTIFGKDNLTQEQQSALDAVIAAYNPLVETKRASCAHVDAKAEALCTNLITTGLTQQNRYSRKLAQAEALLQDASPTETAYPLIFNEVGITASNAGAVAKAIVAAAETYDAFCDQVEAARMQAKAAIKAASNASLVASAEAAVIWPTA